MSYVLSSLRSRLIFLVLLPIIPLIALLLYSVLEQHRLAAAQAQSTTLTYVDEITDSQEQIIEGAHQLLIGLAQLPEVRRHDARACNKFFSTILQRLPLYTNLAAVRPNGDVFCSGVPLKAPVNLADRPYFQETLQTHDFAVSSYLIGRISGKPAIALAFPSLDKSDNVHAVVFVGVSITWLDRTIARMSLPPGSAVTLMDQEGKILYRHPDPEKWVGKPARGPFIKPDQLLAGQKVATEGIGMDGVPRIFAFSMVHGMPADRAVIVRVGIPKALIFAEANRTFRRDIAIMVLVILVALISAWAFSEQSLLLPTKSLANATSRLAAGDLGVRTGLPYNGGELGRLAKSFDSMAEALQMRQAEAKRAQEEIRNLAKFPEENPSPVLRVNHDGQILEVNSASFPLLQEWGCQARGFVPQFWREVVSDSLASGTRKLIDAVCREQIFSLSVVPIQDAGYVNLYGTDVTERRKVEEVLREDEARFRSYFELPLIGIAITSPEKGWIEVNDQICSMMGYSREELLRMTWSELTHPEDLAADVEQFNRILAGQIDSYSMNKRFIRKNGEVVWTSIAVGCIRDSGGRVKHILALGLDITERKLAEEALREADRKYHSIFENAAEGIFQSTPDGRFLAANPALARMFGYQTPEELVATITDIPTQLYVNFKDRQSFQQLLEKFGFVEAFEAEFHHRDGQKIWISINARAVKDENGTVRYYEGTVEDITARKQAREALRQYATRLATLSRRLMEVQETERQYLARELHDEIGQALTAVSINLQGAVNVADPSYLKSRIEESLQMIGRSIEQVRNLSFELRPAILDDLGLVPAIRSYVDHQAQRGGLKAELNLGPLNKTPAPEVGTACFRIVQGALTNVIRHARASGVRVELSQQGDDLKLGISDDGVGFDLGTLKEKGLTEGSLGLLGMEERVQLVGGVFKIDSSEGAGTRVEAIFLHAFRASEQTT